MTYYDWKPRTYYSGECLRCGFRYFIVEEIMSPEELDERKIDYDVEEDQHYSNEFTEEEKRSIRKFDEAYGLNPDKTWTYIPRKLKQLFTILGLR